MRIDRLPHPRRLSRRQLLTAAAGALALGRSGNLLASASASTTLPAPSRSGIDHIVVVMMENRSFDHLAGWLPGADGKQAGLSYVDRSGLRYTTHQLAPDFQGCSFNDPDHSFEGGRIEWDRGRCDGWLRANDLLSIGYYNQADLPFYGRAAAQWTACDRYFSAIVAETYPNRFIQHAGQTDRLHNSSPGQTLPTTSTLPTIWDRLAAKGISGTYYYGDIPFTALWGTKYLSISRPFTQFLADAEAGTLPSVSFIDPRFEDETSGTSGDNHPHADIRNGEVFMNAVYTAITTGPKWGNTVLVINFDEWGGFFDHVSPPVAPVPPLECQIGNQDGLRGFRVPALIISPWSRRGSVAHTVYDHASVLRMIEWRWGLAPLTARDAQANNLAAALDFAHPDLSAPVYLVPPGPYGVPCPAGTTASEEEWGPVRTLAEKFGFAVG